MTLFSEMRLRARHVVVPVLAIVVLGYMAFHLIHGNRGLIAWRALEERVAERQTEANALEAQRRAVEAKVDLLNPESLDADMLDEWARRLLNFGRPDDIIIFVDEAGAPPARKDGDTGPPFPR